MTTIINVDRFSIASQKDGAVNCVAVLTGGTRYEAGRDGDICVYMGIGDPSWVAAHGNKLSYAAAKGHFPYLEKESYRD